MSSDTEGSGLSPVSAPGGSGRNLPEPGSGVSDVAARTDNSYPQTSELMEAVVERENMLAAYHRVKINKGSPGADGMTVQALKGYLDEHWLRIREELLGDRYHPSAVLSVQIPKAGGRGMRQLGIPTVLDRLVQQALLQVLQPIFDPTFSESSYGFRPGRSGQQAVAQARSYVESGRRWVVDMDLEKFFDRVNHDILMSRVARRIKDKRVLRLIRRYLQAGMMEGGLVSPRVEGTPQGGPLSPLLSNILLDDLDQELERRGHKFCRYADDCNIYVHTQRAGERVMESLSQFLEKRLRLQINRAKSAVDRPWKRKFLGYSMTSERTPRLKVAAVGIERFKDKLRTLFREGRGRNLGRFINEELNPVLRGWLNYFRLSGVRGVFGGLDGWIRRKLRCVLWRQWKRSFTRAKKLKGRGMSEERAWKSATNGRGPWWNAGSSHMNQAYPKTYFDKTGLVSLVDQLRIYQGSK